MHESQKPRLNCLGFLLHETLRDRSVHIILSGQLEEKAHVSTKTGITAAGWCISAPLEKDRAAVWLPFMVSFYLPREKLLSDSCYRFKLPQKDHAAANQ